MTVTTPELAPATLAPPLEGDEPPLVPSRPYVSPRVNLLPPEVAERKALRKLQAALVAGVLICGAAVGGLYVMSDSGRASAQATLDQAVTDGSRLQTAKTRLLPVQTVRTQVQAAKQALVNAMGAEVLWSSGLDQIRLRLPDGVRLQSLTVTPAAVVAAPVPVAPSPSASTTTAPAAAPAAASGVTTPALPVSGTIATVTLAGIGVDLNHVAAWLDAMPKLRGWSGVYLSTATADDKGLVTFAATANIGSAALSHRYTNGSTG